MILRTLLLIVFLGGSQLIAEDRIAGDRIAEDRILFEIDDPDAAKPWQIVNGGVTGGCSDGRFKINEDKQAGPFMLEVEWINAGPIRVEVTSFKVGCEGTYQHHLQGVCAGKDAIYWCFTTTLVKTDMKGSVLKQVPVANHHGDLCFHDGKLYVAVNLGKFNDPEGNADSWIYVYDAESLKELARHETQEVFHGAGGIGFRGGHFFVVGGLPDGVDENYVYEYDGEFRFLKKHIIKSGHTHLGIQTATFAHNRWWFGCYGDPKIMLVTDADFQMKGRHEIDCSLGIEGLTGGRLLVGSGRCEKDKGCTGSVETALPDEQVGFRIVEIKEQSTQ